VGAQHYANIIQADATYRRLISAATQIVRRAHESGASVDEVTAVLSEAEALIAMVRETGVSRDFVHIKELLNGFLETAQAGTAATAAEARSSAPVLRPGPAAERAEAR
jgi:replicative DNA helicase